MNFNPAGGVGLVGTTDLPDGFTDQLFLVTGSAGFLGSHVVERLLASGVRPERLIRPRSASCDLRDRYATDALLHQHRPDVVIHMAARLGGIGDNRAHPANYLYDNIMMGMNVVEACRTAEIRKLVNIGTVCSYPKVVAAPFREEDLWNGYPEETNAPYGIAKKTVMTYAQAVHQQYGMCSVNLLMANLYGPGDDFRDATSHVIPAIIRKVDRALQQGDERIVAWGDGSPTRDFLYVSDAAEAIIRAAAFHTDSAPVNVGAGAEVRIRDVIDHVKQALGFNGETVWDMSRPNGQPRRVLDVSKAQMSFGFRARTSFEAGLRNTVTWYLEHREQIDRFAPKYTVPA